jgi:hypothetical protein
VTVADLVHNQEDVDRGHDCDHQESLCGDSASCITPRGMGHCRDHCDLCHIICSRDAHGQIKTGAEIGSVNSKNYDQPHRERSPEAGHIPGVITAYSLDLKQVRWPVNIKPSGIEKYDGPTNPAEWLDVYQLTIKVVRGDSYVTANYLLVCLSSSTRSWVLGLLTGLVRSWNHLRRLFTSNFCATCAQLGVDWDLASIAQKKGESLREYIQCFCNKRNAILEVDIKSIVMFFKKGLRDSSLIQKFAMKKPRTSEQIFPITNRLSLAEEMTLDTREQRKESGHPDQPSSSKGHDTKRKLDHSVNAVERPRCHKEYRPRPSELEGFLDHICIFHPRESTRPEITTYSKVLQMRFSRRPNRPIMRRSPKIPRVISPRHTRKSAMCFVAPTRMSPRGSKKS